MNFKSFFILILPIMLSFCGCMSSNDSNSRDESEVTPKEGVVEIDGFPLRYIRRGTGEPLLVIGSSVYYSKAYSKALEEQFEMIYIDSRHFVPDCQISDEALSRIDLSTFSDDVETVRQQLGLEKAGVIGHSVHAQIALDYAARFPEHTSKLVLIAGVPYQGEEIQQLNDQHWEGDADDERKAILQANLQILESSLDTTPADRYFSLTYHLNAPKYWADPNFDATSLLKDLRTCPQLIGKLFGSVPLKEEVQAKLDQLSMPTLLILGKLDFAIPYRAWEEIVAGNEKIDYILMEEASHNPHTEPGTVKAFDRHLTEWLASLQ